MLDAEERKIPWAEVSHIDNAQMRDLMKDSVVRLYMFQMRSGESGYQAWTDRWDRIAEKWGESEISSGRPLIIPIAPDNSDGPTTQ